MRTVDALLECYSESHRNATNKAIHWICVPMIVWSLLGILWSISKPGALVVVALAVAFYPWLSWPLAVGMIAVLALMLYPLTLLGSHALTISIAVFVVFSLVYLKEVPNWRSGAAFVLIFAAVVLAVTGKAKRSADDGPVTPQSALATRRPARQSAAIVRRESGRTGPWCPGSRGRGRQP